MQAHLGLHPPGVGGPAAARARTAEKACAPEPPRPLVPGPPLHHHHHHHRPAPLPPPRGILDSYRASSSTAPSGEADDAADDADGDALAACPIECVKEIVGAEDEGVAAFDAALAAAPAHALVVVDFYKTACGACRYVAPGFVKLCKKAGQDDEEETDVIFLKHNVLDEDGGRTALAVREGVRAVPTFYFYRGGQRIESFPTRDRAVIAAAVNRLVGREVL